MMISEPDRVIRGNPLEVELLTGATTTGFSGVPSGLMLRSLTCALSPATSIQLTSASPLSNAIAPTRPRGLPSSTRIGAPNFNPPSVDRATFTCGLSSGAVNHAIAAFDPAEESEGPL